MYRPIPDDPFDTSRPTESTDTPTHALHVRLVLFEQKSMLDVMHSVDIAGALDRQCTNSCIVVISARALASWPAANNRPTLCTILCRLVPTTLFLFPVEGQ